MRVQLRNTKGSDLYLGPVLIPANGTRWFSDSELRELAKSAQMDMWSLFNNGTLAYVASEGDVFDTQCAPPLIVKAPNGTLYQITVDNAGVLSTSAVTAGRSRSGHTYI